MCAAGVLLLSLWLWATRDDHRSLCVLVFWRRFLLIKDRVLDAKKRRRRISGLVIGSGEGKG